MPRNSGTFRHRLHSGMGQAVCLIGISLAGLSLTCLSATIADDASETETETKTRLKTKPEFRTELIRGKVVWQADALRNEFGISTVSEAAENALAILTPDGELMPIVENVRGRAFRKDERLRGQDMELLVRQYEKQPLVQILRVYQIEGNQRFEVDYWCDVCAIVMFETGPCSCCQDDNRLRKRPVDEDDPDHRRPSESSDN